jgi:hypothetical protein
MPELTLPVEATQDASTGIEPTVSQDSPPQPPVLVTEQEVMLGTAAAVRPGSVPIARRTMKMLRAVGAALRPPAPRPHYASRAAYIEYACMAREMDRL